MCKVESIKSWWIWAAKRGGTCWWLQMQRSWNRRWVPCVVTPRKIINPPLHTNCIQVRCIVEKLFPGMFLVTWQVNELGDKSHSQSSSWLQPHPCPHKCSVSVQDPAWRVSAVFLIFGYLLGCCGRTTNMLEASFAWLPKCTIMIALVMAVGWCWSQQAGTRDE